VTEKKMKKAHMQGLEAEEEDAGGDPRQIAL
jgi:hypothetical protein